MSEGEKLKRALVSPEEFSENLERVLFKHDDSVRHSIHEGDYESRRQINIDMENHIFHRHYGILIQSGVLLRKRPLKYLCAIVMFLIKSDKLYLKQTIYNRYMRKEI